MVDPVELTRDLIRCNSVTPAEGGAISHLDALLSEAGFVTTRIDRGGIANLFARWGKGRTLGFNGHTDVVPTGDIAQWRFDPFGAEIDGKTLYGRGAVDMKSGVAAFVAAAIDLVKNDPPEGSIVITITGDEEGAATDGTIAILDWMQTHGETMDACIVGEPTCPDALGDMMKIGRRGSMTAYITATGTQGHAAYPHRAHNPLPVMTRLLTELAETPLDDGTAHFDPSTLAITTIDTGNPANNVIPATTRATVNIRFNDAHSSASLIAMLDAKCRAVEEGTGVTFSNRYQVSGESFFTQPGPFSQLISDAVAAQTGRTPEASTSGGTSDARFIKDHCPVVEFGLVGKTMHQVDECVDIDDVRALKSIYARIIAGFFEKGI